ncbi:hypothetical protein [Erwinia amylovora]|uniref:hypothetical protein n=1 Tax=Erwinia amylovora TaxID=552 RepID=UPI000C075E37|nr:hypothetical protein [Erwinia amylovora]
MELTKFIEGNEYLEKLSNEELERRFDLYVVVDLPDNDFSQIIVKLLNSYLSEYSNAVFHTIERLDVLEKLKIYESWIYLLKERKDMERLMQQFIRFSLLHKL